MRKYYVLSTYIFHYVMTSRISYWQFKCWNYRLVEPNSKSSHAKLLVKDEEDSHSTTLYFHLLRLQIVKLFSSLFAFSCNFFWIFLFFLVEFTCLWQVCTSIRNATPPTQRMVNVTAFSFRLEERAEKRKEVDTARSPLWHV